MKLLGGAGIALSPLGQFAAFAQDDAPPSDAPPGDAPADPGAESGTESGAHQRIPALEYHNVNYADDVNNIMTPEWFQEQMQWLGENGYHGISADELHAYAREGASMPEKSVILTFDLGRCTSEVVDVIAPTLQAFGLHGIIYILADLTDNPFSIYSDEQKVWWQRYREWYDAGVISFGSHSITHRSFYKLDRETALWELTESKRLIEEGLGVPIHTYAYAYEAAPVHFSIVEALDEAGYTTAFAGASRARHDLQVWPNDPLWFKLPRLLPYYADEYRIIENRQPGLTFAQLMERNTHP